MRPREGLRSTMGAWRRSMIFCSMNFQRVMERIMKSFQLRWAGDVL